jgi:tRNA A-37 threonylcarbamoyl transferase component Bud32
MQCPTCKQVLDDGVRFCPHDGTPLIDTGATRADSTPTGGKRHATKELELPVVIGGRYRLEEKRGGGGMAKVYKAVDVTLEREVAVKLINPELRAEKEFDDRFQREARIASQLADPHIVVVHDFGLDPTHGPFLVMEYLQGQSLRERLATAGPLPLKACLQLAGQLFLALVHAHGKGIVHRDIKPDNIFLLNQSGVRLHVRVLDFGIARIYKGDNDGSTPTITHAGAVLGTPRYMSPEQLAGQPVDARSDLYSAALVIWESLTGQLPYLHGKRLCETCPEATPALQDLLEQCLKPAPEERPPTAVEVYLRLQELGKASGILLLPPGAMDRLVAARRATDSTVTYVPKGEQRKRIRRRMLIGAVAAVALLGAAWLGKLFFFSPSPNVDGPERLHGMRVGDLWSFAWRQAHVVGLGGGPADSCVNPWKHPHTRALMSPALREADLGADGKKADELAFSNSDDAHVVVIIDRNSGGNPVVGILSTSPQARTNRGVGVGSDASLIAKRYGDEVKEEESHLVRGHSVEVQRFPWLGLAFEVRQGKVAAVALYPPKR